MVVYTPRWCYRLMATMNEVFVVCCEPPRRNHLLRQRTFTRARGQNNEQEKLRRQK